MQQQKQEQLPGRITSEQKLLSQQRLASLGYTPTETQGMGRRALAAIAHYGINNRDWSHLNKEQRDDVVSAFKGGGTLQDLSSSGDGSSQNNVSPPISDTAKNAERNATINLLKTKGTNIPNRLVAAKGLLVNIDKLEELGGKFANKYSGYKSVWNKDYEMVASKFTGKNTPARQAFLNYKALLKATILKMRLVDAAQGTDATYKALAKFFPENAAEGGVKGMMSRMNNARDFIRKEMTNIKTSTGMDSKKIDDALNLPSGNNSEQSYFDNIARKSPEGQRKWLKNNPDKAERFWHYSDLHHGRK